MKSPRLIMAFALAASLLTACTSGAPAASPKPDSLAIFDGRAWHQLAPGDTANAAVVRTLDRLIGGLDTPLYSAFPPERFAAEIAALPRLEASWAKPVTLNGKGYQPTAIRLAVVITDGSRLVMSQPADGANWVLCETSDAGRFDELVRAVKTRTVVSIQ